MKQNERVTGKEQYYTPLGTASDCLDILMSQVDTAGREWLEPGGGTGAFIDCLISKGIPESQITSFDIEPKHPLIRKTLDFLSEDLSSFHNLISVGNPPFGRANKLSIPFFNKCAEVSDFVAFIVPKSWRKWSVQNRLNPYFHLLLDKQIDVDFIPGESGKEARSKGKLATVFQIWERQKQKRTPVLVEDRGYIVKTCPTDADVCLTVFGRGCGKVETDFERVPNTTKMFLKVKSSEVTEALKNLDFGKFCNNVAFVEALSIREIKFLLNEYFDSLGKGL